jgi:O-antigen/teichoic acid export membrane protein
MSGLLLVFHPRTRSAIAWTVGGQLVSQVLRLGSNLILTRLLVPEMFGVMAVANVLLIGLSLLSDVGIRQKVIQREAIDADFLDSVWAVQIGRGLIIAALLSVAAIGLKLDLYGAMSLPGVYGNPALPLVLISLAVVALIQGFASTNLHLAARQRDVGAITRIDLIGQIVSIFVMVGYATVSPTILALIWGNVAGAAVRCVLSHMLLPGGASRLRYKRAHVGEIWRFGRWIVLSSLMTFLASHGDRLILGGLIDAKTLGVVGIALFLVESVRGIFARLVANVAFPIISDAARANTEAIREKLARGQKLLDVAAPMTAGLLWALGPITVKTLYDARYESAGLYLSVVGISLYAQRYSLAAQLLMVQGRSRAYSMRSVLEALFVLFFVPVGFSLWGISGALAATVVARFLVAPYLVAYTRDWQILTFRSEFRALAVFLGAALIGSYLSSLLGLLLENITR